MSFNLRSLLLLGLLGQSVVAQASLVQQNQESEAYLQGVAEAHQEMEAGYVTSYTYGLRSRAGYDEQLGLPLTAIAGCMVDDAILDRARGHNETIQRWLENGRTLPNSLAPYQHQLENPERAFSPSEFLSLATATEGPFHQLTTLASEAGQTASPRFYNRLHNREFQLWLYSTWTDVQIAFPTDTDLFFVLRYQDGSPHQWHYQVFDGVGGTLLTTKSVHRQN